MADSARPRALFLRLAPLLLLLPLLLPKAIDNGYYVGLLNRILVYAILVASLDLVVGYIGDVSIGHAGLFAIGAYTVAVLTASPNLNTESSIQHLHQLPFLVALVPAVLLTAFAGFLLGFPALRSSGPYLAVITIVYGLIIYTFINEQEALTNGTKGITLSTSAARRHLRLGGINYFYVVYPVLVLVMFVVHNVTHSFWGRAFEAIKYSGVAAESCGISRSYFKVAAFVLSAALAGLAGGFFAQLDSYVAPNTFAYNFSVEFLIALIFGGVRSVAREPHRRGAHRHPPRPLQPLRRLPADGLRDAAPAGPVLHARGGGGHRPAASGGASGRWTTPPSSPSWTGGRRGRRALRPAAERGSAGARAEGRGDALRRPPGGAGPVGDHPPRRGARAHRPERQRQVAPRSTCSPASTRRPREG